ncbi:hypothetical protein Rhe02_12760 [Rhizocola hellebori]|uniref:Uncharacterized protein n=2 Tax=Rhizocola hellebori TaxID=1392758 RepID=A0A8J3Q3S1_9ACTN|nr:hypothetical protein Rhe02_12760 [Rhizocola hellebori]
MVIFLEIITRRGPFCRDCGMTTFRDLTAETLVAGWWSVLSFFTTPFVLLLNLWGRYKVTKLAAPQADPVYVAPNMRPLDPVKPVFARPQSWLGVAFIIALVTLGVIYRPGPTDEASRGCILADRYGYDDEFVNCDMPHDARVIAVVSDWSLCPDRTEHHFEYLAKFYCIVEEHQR